MSWTSSERLKYVQFCLISGKKRQLLFSTQNNTNIQIVNSIIVNPLSAHPSKWSNTMNGLSVFGHFVGLVLKVSNVLSQKSYWDSNLATIKFDPHIENICQKSIYLIGSVHFQDWQKKWSYLKDKFQWMNF